MDPDNNILVKGVHLDRSDRFSSPPENRGSLYW